MSDARSKVDVFQRRIPTLDGWRAVAILLVLLDHGADPLLRAGLALSGHAGAFDSESYAWLKDPIGRAGVHLFFALSGYLITRRLLQEELRFGAISVGGFYLRRLSRIQPAAIVFLLVVGALGLSGVLAVSGPGWRAALLGYANFAMASQTWYTAHFWSLAVEEHFYLLWPLVFAFLGPRRRWRARVAIALLLGVWLGIVVRYHVAYSPYLWVRSDIEGSWVMWGCVAALAEATPGRRACSSGCCRARVSALVALPLALFSLLFSGLDWKIVCGATVLTAAATPLLLIGTMRRPRGGLGTRCSSCRRSPGSAAFPISVYLWQEIFFVWDDARSCCARRAAVPALAAHAGARLRRGELLRHRETGAASGRARARAPRAGATAGGSCATCRRTARTWCGAAHSRAVTRSAATRAAERSQRDCLGLDGLARSLVRSAETTWAVSVCSFSARRLRVFPVAHHRQVAPQFLQQVDQLGDLLLGQQIDLQVQMRALLGELRLAILRDQHHRGSEHCHEREEALQPGEGRRIEWLRAATQEHQIHDDPGRHEHQQGNDIAGPRHQTARPLKPQLRSACRFKLTAAQLHDFVDVLRDVVRQRPRCVVSVGIGCGRGLGHSRVREPATLAPQSSGAHRVTAVRQPGRP